MLLWMVVSITLSGVLLAGIQLVAAYRLASVGKAAFEQGGQLNIEHNKISLGSSVTGLMILGISFAFFLVFVTKVYLITEVNSASNPPAGAMLPAQSPIIPNARVATVLPAPSTTPNPLPASYSGRGGTQKRSSAKQTALPQFPTPIGAMPAAAVPCASQTSHQ